MAQMIPGSCAASVIVDIDSFTVGIRSWGPAFLGFRIELGGQLGTQTLFSAPIGSNAVETF